MFNEDGSIVEVGTVTKYTLLIENHATFGVSTSILKEVQFQGQTLYYKLTSTGWVKDPVRYTESYTVFEESFDDMFSLWEKAFDPQLEPLLKENYAEYEDYIREIQDLAEFNF